MSCPTRNTLRITFRVTVAALLVCIAHAACGPGCTEGYFYGCSCPSESETPSDPSSDSGSGPSPSPGAGSSSPSGSSGSSGSSTAPASALSAVCQTYTAPLNDDWSFFEEEELCGTQITKKRCVPAGSPKSLSASSSESASSYLQTYTTCNAAIVAACRGLAVALTKIGIVDFTITPNFDYCDEGGEICTWPWSECNTDNDCNGGRKLPCCDYWMSLNPCQGISLALAEPALKEVFKAAGLCAGPDFDAGAVQSEIQSEIYDVVTDLIPDVRFNASDLFPFRRRRNGNATVTNSSTVRRDGNATNSSDLSYGNGCFTPPPTTTTSTSESTVPETTPMPPRTLSSSSPLFLGLVFPAVAAAVTVLAADQVCTGGA